MISLLLVASLQLVQVDDSTFRQRLPQQAAPVVNNIVLQDSLAAAALDRLTREIERQRVQDSISTEVNANLANSIAACGCAPNGSVWQDRLLVGALVVGVWFTGWQIKKLVDKDGTPGPAGRDGRDGTDGRDGRDGTDARDFPPGPPSGRPRNE